MDQLTSYELLDLFTTYGMDAGGHFMNFLAVFSAYLVAGYVLAGKLNRTILALLSALLVLVTAMTVIGQYMVQLVAIDIAGEIVRRGTAIGGNAAAAASLFAGPKAGLIAYVSPAIQVVACIGAIAFAHSRAARTRRESALNNALDTDA